MNPARGRLLLRKLETDETLPGGLIYLLPHTREQMTTCQMEVVAVGPSALCEDLEECERFHEDGVDHRGRRVGFHPIPSVVKPGAWVILTPRRLVEAGTDGLYLAGQDDVIAVVAP